MNSTFVNVSLSTSKVMTNGKYPMNDLLQSSKGWWVMNNEVAKQIKYVFPVKKNKVLGVFEVISFESGPDEKTGRTRVNFELKMIFEGSSKLIEKANNELSATHYVVKQFEI